MAMEVSLRATGVTSRAGTAYTDERTGLIHNYSKKRGSREPGDFSMSGQI